MANPRRNGEIIMPIQIGKTYLDTWGQEHKINGYARPYGVEDKGIVWSMSSHFRIEDGQNTSPGHNLVNDLDMKPVEAFNFWNNRISDIESVNPPDKLTLIAESLATMRKRRRMWELIAFPRCKVT